MTTPSARLVIGVTGSFGSGATTVTRVFEAMGFTRVALSSIVREEAAAKKVKPTRANLQDLGDRLREDNSPHYLIESALTKLEAEQEGRVERLVIDGLRNMHEVSYLRERFHNFYLLAVHAPESVRWERLKSTYSDDRKSFDLDDSRDQNEEVEYGQQVQLCVDDADYLLDNSSQHGIDNAVRLAIRPHLEQIVGLMDGTETRAPSRDEVNMTLAYTASAHSLCLKRWVGAVIERDGVILSVGYNENPEPIKPCVLDPKYCFKDKTMFVEMSRNWANVPCPACKNPIGDPASKAYRCPSCGVDLIRYAYPDRGMQFCTALHAEDRALRDSKGSDLSGATIYTTTFPCFNCAKEIVYAGIKSVVYVEPYPVALNREFLERAGVAVRLFSGVKARAFQKLFPQHRVRLEAQHDLRKQAAEGS